MTVNKLLTMTSEELAEWILHPTTRSIRDRSEYVYGAYMRSWRNRRLRKSGTSFRVVVPRK